MKTSTNYTLDCSGHYLLHRSLGVTELADNGNSNDEAVTLNVALGGHKADDYTRAIAFLSTNADPIVIATAILTSETRYSTSWTELDWELMLDSHGEAIPLDPWIRSALTEKCGIKEEVARRVVDDHNKLLAAKKIIAQELPLLKQVAKLLEAQNVIGDIFFACAVDRLASIVETKDEN